MTNLQLTTPIALMATIAAVGMTAMAFASVAVENYIQGFRSTFRNLLAYCNKNEKKYLN